MLPKNLSSVCLFNLSVAAGLALGLAVALPAAEPVADLPLMPWPAQVEFGAPADRLVVASRIAVSLTGGDELRINDALARLAQAWSHRLSRPVTISRGDQAPAEMIVSIDHSSASLPALGDNESYHLQIGGGRAVIRAATTFGALRAVATLQQALQVEAKQAWLPALAIEDAPRFSWRGLMIDVARHWQPIDVIKRNLDGMALVKLNVLHLHLTDDQGFRVESKTHPELTAKGSDGNYFTQTELREIIAYAAARGIRVVPEFDVPGHATAWVVSHPELASLPGTYQIERHWGVFDPVLDPTNEHTYTLLADFLGEMCALFPDEFVHIGGDENNGVQWNANPRIQAFIREHGLKDNAGLHNYFNQHVSEILRQHGKRLLGWDEILNPGLPKESVIDSWRGPEALASAARMGYAGILANGYYIDLNYPAHDHYSADPLPSTTDLQTVERARVLGGEATMWAEWVAPENIDTRIWPRTAAIAERLWSPVTVRDLEAMYARLPAIDRDLQDAGLQQGTWPKFPGVPREVADALTILANAVEPVKKYQRGALQPDHVQSTPLNQLADWSRPDSAAARNFNRLASTWIAHGFPADDAAVTFMEKQLQWWHEAGRRAAEYFSGSDPVSAAQRQTSLELTAISEVGTSCLRALQMKQSLSADDEKHARAAFEKAAVPNYSAVEFPFLPSLQTLLDAASKAGPAPSLNSKSQ